MLELPQVTLLVIDCKDVDRAIASLKVSSTNVMFGQTKLLTTKALSQTLSTNVSPIRNLQVETIEPIDNIRAYSKFMIRKLVNYVSTPHVLCTQWDGFIVNHKAWSDDWLNYDYIGAPWWFNDSKTVGNGGFSLRSKRFLKAASNLPIKNFHPEDLVTCRTYRHLLSASGIQFAPENTAERFSLEGNATHHPRWNGQFGWHDSEMTDLSNYKGELPEEVEKEQQQRWGRPRNVS